MGDNVDPDTGEMEVNEIEQETVMDDDRKSNEIQKDNNEETSMDVIQNNTTFKRTISDDEDDDDDKNNKNHLQRMREIKYRKIIIIKIQEGKFKIIKLLKKGLERNQKRMKSVKIKYKKKKKKKRWSPQNPKEDGVEKKIKKKKTKSNEIEDQWRILQTKNGTML